MNKWLVFVFGLTICSIGNAGGMGGSTALSVTRMSMPFTAREGVASEAPKSLLIVRVSRIGMVREFGKPLTRPGVSNEWSTTDHFVNKVITSDFGNFTIHSVNAEQGIATATTDSGESAQIIEVAHFVPAAQTPQPRLEDHTR